MKKTYKNPTLMVVNVKPAQFIAVSGPMMLRGTTTATSGNLGRRAEFSDWDEDEE